MGKYSQEIKACTCFLNPHLLNLLVLIMTEDLKPERPSIGEVRRQGLEFVLSVVAPGLGAERHAEVVEIYLARADNPNDTLHELPYGHDKSELVPDGVKQEVEAVGADFTDGEHRHSSYGVGAHVIAVLTGSDDFSRAVVDVLPEINAAYWNR